jgi:hypothetical protein
MPMPPASGRSPPTDFLTLWKDADPDIPSLKQAKAEYYSGSLTGPELQAMPDH